MKFSINKQSLRSLLEVVNKAVSTRTVLPALAGVLIEAEENEVSFRTTNMELSIKAWAPALIEEDGKAVFPAKLLYNIVNTLQDEAVSIEANTDFGKLTCANSSFKLMILNSVDFPQFPQVDATDYVNIDFNTFSTMVKKVAQMASNDDTRAILQGVNINVNTDSVEFVATDAYRIAVSKQNLSTQNSKEFSAVIPANFLSDIANLHGDPQKDVKISLSANQVLIEYDNMLFINRRIVGNFPDYNNLINNECPLSLKLNIKNLANSVRRIAALSQQAQIVKLDFDTSSAIVKISGTAQDIGSCDDSIECKYDQNCTLEKLLIAFNSQYLLEGLGCLKSEEVVLKLSQDTKPAFFYDADNSNNLYILLPVKVS